MPDKGHRSCSDNDLEVLQPWKIERHQLPHPVNSSLARPGHVVELKALMNVVAGVSACPMDLNAISSFTTRSLAIEVL